VSLQAARQRREASMGPAVMRGRVMSISMVVFRGGYALATDKPIRGI
jgi:hypothetical protein